MNAIKNIFTSVVGWFSSFFGNAAVPSAELAGILVARNNKGKARAILITADALLLSLEKGNVDQTVFDKFFKEDVLSVIKDEEIRVIVGTFINVPTIKIGEVNKQAIAILSSFIKGLRIGIGE